MRLQMTTICVYLSKWARFTKAPSTSNGSGRIPFGALTRAALAVALTAVLGASAAVAQSDANTLGSVHYAVGHRICQAAKPGESSCFAIRRVEVAAETPGAKPFYIAAGANLREAVSPAVTTIGPAGGLTPYDLATAYGFSSTTSTAQVVAIVDAYNDPNIAADLATFDTEYGLAACTVANGCLKIVNQTGGTTLPANDTTGWASEISLDVEAVHSVCQKCKIILVEANSNSNADLGTAENEAVTLKATEVSNSWGGPEAPLDTTLEAAFNHPGIVLVASAGDDGYYTFDKLAMTNMPNTPAAYNTVVAVGGTSLYLGQTAVRQNETVWNDNGTKDYWEKSFGTPLGATGGGCSTIIPARAWQSNLSNWSKAACGTHRLVSDVSAVGDYLTGFDIYISYDCGGACSTGWQTIGGTSLSAPIISAMFALAGGNHGVAYPALLLYGHLGGASLYNVTSGGNGWCGGEGAAACGNPNTMGDGVLDCDYPPTGSTPAAGDVACDAGPGFNGPTGVGTPNGLGAFAFTGPAAIISGPTSVSSGTNNGWTATTTDPFPKGSVSSFTWNWGDGSANTITSTGAASHTYSVVGDYTITLTVKDNYGITGTKTFMVTVT